MMCGQSQRRSLWCMKWWKFFGTSDYNLKFENTFLIQNNHQNKDGIWNEKIKKAKEIERLVWHKLKKAINIYRLNQWQEENEKTEIQF